MAKNTDPSFQQSRFQGAPKPRRYSAEGCGGGVAEATRKAFFEESARRQQYRQPVRIEKSRTAREE